MITLDHYMHTLKIIQAALGCPDYHIQVCSNPDYHRRYWRYNKGAFECEACEKLNNWIRYYEHGHKTA